MAEYKQTFLNVVVLGNLNPQILNHNWLVKQRIIKKSLYDSTRNNTGNPFTEYISIPPMTRLAYGSLVFTVESEKFTLQNNISNIDTGILQTAKKYFEKLPHTPVKKLGFNLHGLITFENKVEENRFDLKYVDYGDALKDITNTKNIRFGFTALFFENDVMHRLECAKTPNQSKVHVNYNCEFNLKNIEQLQEILTQSSKLIRKMDKKNRKLAVI